MKPLITLITDLGDGDFYLASLKGKILSQMPDAQIIDINNKVTQHSVLEASYVLKNVLNDFPEGTIHIVGVGAQSLDDIEHLIIQFKGQYIITANNGLFSILTDEKAEFIGQVIPSKNIAHLTFPARELYAPIAVHLAKGGKPEEIASPFAELVRSFSQQPAFGEGFIRGVIQYVDSFGNAVSNIHTDLIQQVGKGADFIVGFRHKGYEIRTISRRYSDVMPSERLALINSAGFIEIAINQGHAANLLGLHEQEIVIISFDD